MGLKPRRRREKKEEEEDGFVTKKKVGFFFFWEYVWVGPVGYLVNNVFWFKNLGWGWFFLGLMLGFYFWACSVTIFFFFFPESLLPFFFFFKILVQNLFGIKLLRVFMILLEGVPIFFMGKQIKKFKLLYIYIYFCLG